MLQYKDYHYTVIVARDTCSCCKERKTGILVRLSKPSKTQGLICNECIIDLIFDGNRKEASLDALELDAIISDIADIIDIEDQQAKEEGEWIQDSTTAAGSN